VNALRVPRTRLATSAANQVTFRVTAPTQLARALDVVVVVSLLVAVVETRSATSAQRLAILLATALRPVDTEAAKVVDMEETKDTVAVAVSAADVKVDRPATPAVDMVTCLVIALKAKSATTVAKSVTCPVIAVRQPPTSEFATSASSQVMFKLHARTKSLQWVSRHAALRNTLRMTILHFR